MQPFHSMSRNALILVDLQNDFMPGGALAVAEGDLVVPIANELEPLFDLVVATQDWHPADHGSFASQHPGEKPGDVITLNGLEQVLWPDHCVQGSLGAEFHRDLELDSFDHVVRKGTDPAIDSYSAFFDNRHLKSTGLDVYLRDYGVKEVFLAGLATDYCVLYSALDAVRLGFETTVIVDATRGVELRPGDVDRAVDAMRLAGVRIVQSRELLRRASEARG